MKKVAGIAIGTALLFEKRDRERVGRVLVPACYQGHATLLVEREEEEKKKEKAKYLQQECSTCCMVSFSFETSVLH